MLTTTHTLICDTPFCGAKIVTGGLNPPGQAEWMQRRANNGWTIRHCPKCAEMVKGRPVAEIKTGEKNHE